MTRRSILALLLLLALTGCFTQPSPSDPQAVPTMIVTGTDGIATVIPRAAPEDGVPALQRIAHVFSQRRSITVALASDSTGAEYFNWPRVWAHMVAKQDPSLRVQVRDWDTEKATYRNDLVLSQGGGPGRAGITLVSGSVVGSELDYHMAHLEDLYPATIPVDVLVVNMGHNYKQVTPPNFEKAIDSFLAAYAARHPESAVLITSQNPQFETKDGSYHAARQQRLKAYASSHGYDYLPVYESFLTRPNGGRDLVAKDGVHPTFGKDGEIAPDTKGAIYWAGLMREAVKQAG